MHCRVSDARHRRSSRDQEEGFRGEPNTPQSVPDPRYHREAQHRRHRQSGSEDTRRRDQVPEAARHWEEPFLDKEALADDLDRVAERLRPLLERVQAGGLDPEFSLPDKLQQTVDDIGCGLPDYMDPWLNDGFSFGKEATRALLEWECRLSRKNGEPMSVAIRRVAELTVQAEHLDLHEGAIAGFIRELPKHERDSVTGDVRDHQASEPWKSVLKHGWGTWPSVVKVLAGKGKLTRAGRIILPVGKRR